MNTSVFSYTVPVGDIRLLPLPGINPEDVLLDTQGRIYCGLEDGSIVRMNKDGSEANILINTGGRPLGLDWLADGRLLVCDCLLGLLAIDLSNQIIEVLVDHIDGEKLILCNNPSVAKDGAIYFSDSSLRYPLTEIRREIVENIPTGRLLRRNTNGSVEVLLDKLYFANGVILAPDESFVLVAETGACRINRLWLQGTKKGQREIFADQLPGMPDNMSLGSDGLFWVALPSPADSRLKMVHKLPKALRELIAKIPEELQPAELRKMLVMAFNQKGECIHFLEGDPLRYHLVTGVRESAGQLYAGSVDENAVAVFKIPKLRHALQV